MRHRPGGGRAKLVPDAIEPLHAHRPHHTFGLVHIEALACGVPVAAYPVRGPMDILGFDGRGVHGGSRRIGRSAEGRAAGSRQRTLTADQVAAAAYNWEACTDRFQEGLAMEAPAQPEWRAEAA